MDYAFSTLDVVVFVAFLALVLFVGMWQGRGERDSESYFLAGRGLTWWLIGISLIAANISSEQFVGMIGSAASPVGLAIASYAWIASIGLVIVAFTFLPAFLRSGIYTIPEFLEYRYHPMARALMAISMVGMYVLVTLSAVTYSGGLTMETLFAGKMLFGHPINLNMTCWIIGIIAAAYVTTGGLKACAWADLLQGTALIVGGLLIAWLAFDRLGSTPVAALLPGSAVVPADLADSASGVEKFFALNGDKLHLVLPRGNPDLPWTALALGLWIPNLYYWGLNQYIVQRTLGSKSLAAGQRGLVMAGAIHIFSPLFIVIPGLIAFNLFSADMADGAARDPQVARANAAILEQFERARTMPESLLVVHMDGGWINRNPEKAAEVAAHNERVLSAAPEGMPLESSALTGYKYDSAFPLLIRKLVPPGVRGFILAAILGAIISSLAAMLNSASSIFTMDLYRKYFSKNASERHLVWAGRVAVIVFTLMGCWLAPKLGDPRFGGIFKFMQEFQGYISPGILAAFVIGLAMPKAPPAAGIAALLGGPVMYGALKLFAPGIPFLDRMGIAFVGVVTLMLLITWRWPLAVPLKMPRNPNMDMRSSRVAQWGGAAVIAAILTIYIVFR